MANENAAPEAGEARQFYCASATGLTIEASTSATGTLLEAFYADYDKAFVLENEKEKLSGFAECLSLNDGEKYRHLRNLFGPFREFVFLASDPQTGQRFGGANFIAFPIELGARPDASVLSVNLNYIFVNQAAKRLGYFSRLIHDLPGIVFKLFLEANPTDVSGDWLQNPPPVYLFLEQNDPYKLNREDYERDTAYTGLDQVTRIKIWARRGAKIVDFDYVQPALTGLQGPDYNLVYSLIAPDKQVISACFLREHLRRFFGISVLKGNDPSYDAVASEQLNGLDRLCSSGCPINLLAIDGANLQSPAWQTVAQPKSLRDCLRQA